MYNDPCTKFTWLELGICRSLRNKIEVSHEARRRAASLPILLCHGTSMYLKILLYVDVIVHHYFGRHVYYKFKILLLRILICLVLLIGDDVVLCKYGEKSAQSLCAAGFRHVAFKSYEG